MGGLKHQSSYCVLVELKLFYTPSEAEQTARAHMVARCVFSHTPFIVEETRHRTPGKTPPATVQVLDQVFPLESPLCPCMCHKSVRAPHFQADGFLRAQFLCSHLTLYKCIRVTQMDLLSDGLGLHKIIRAACRHNNQLFKVG